MKSIFKNQEEGRLRAGWRILIFILLFWCFSLAIFAIKPLLGDMTKREFLSDYSLVIVLVLALAASIAVPIARKFLDKKTFKSLGLKRIKRSFSDLLFGFFLSAAMAGAFLLLMVSLGYVEVLDFHFKSLDDIEFSATGYLQLIGVFSLASMTLFLLEHILVGYWEELVFRGYLFQNMTEGMGLVWSILISCFLYGLIHAANPNATLLSTVVIMFFGFLRIYGYLLTKMLWLSMGMHIGWNFFQGPIFGFAASGHKKATFLELNILQPEWISGGTFGPEGSIFIIPILVVALIIMKAWGNQSRRAYENHYLD